MNKTNIPLKQEIPYLKYDFSRYCQQLKEWLIVDELPDYLEQFHQTLNYNLEQTANSKPEEPPTEFRVYIIDSRLNILFANSDATRKISLFYYDYVKHYRNIQDYCFGNGRSGTIPVSAIESDAEELTKFKNAYGYLPLEELCTSFLVIFDVDKNGDDHINIKFLTTYQVQLLIEKFRSKNFIDWKKILKTI